MTKTLEEILASLDPARRQAIENGTAVIIASQTKPYQLKVGDRVSWTKASSGRQRVRSIRWYYGVIESIEGELAYVRNEAKRRVEVEVSRLTYHPTPLPPTASQEPVQVPSQPEESEWYTRRVLRPLPDPEDVPQELRVQVRGMLRKWELTDPGKED